MTMGYHVHHWKLAQDMTRDVPGECACGAKRVFKGVPDGPMLDFKNAPRGLSLYKARSDADKVADEALMKFSHRSNYMGA